MVGNDGSVAVVKSFHEIQEYYAFQSIVFHLKVAESKMPLISNVNELYSPNSLIFLLNTDHYGTMAKVKCTRGSNISVVTLKCAQPLLNNVLEIYERRFKQYMSNRNAASQAEVSSLLFSRITGILTVSKNNGPNALKTNIGLNLKSNKKDLEVPGFSLRNPNTKEWFFSTKATKDVLKFRTQYPRLFENLEAILPDSGHTVSEVQLLEGCR